MTPNIPHGAVRMIGQSQPGDRYHDATTGRWKKLKPRWPVIGEDELIIRRCTVEQLTLVEDELMETPTISVTEDEEEGFRIMATSHNTTAPAGERLFRAKPWPEIQFVHATREAAEADAAVLSQYITEKWPTKGKAQAKREEGKG